MKTKTFTINALASIVLINSSSAAVSLVGVNTTTTATTWATDGLISEGGINYENSSVGNFAFVSGGSQGSTAAVSVEWPTAGTIDTTMGTAGGGTLKWTGSASAGDTLVWQGIAPEAGTYLIANAGDLLDTAHVAANKVTLAAGQVATWVDSDPTTNEQYSFIQVNDATNANNGGNVGAWGAALVPVPEPSSSALLGLGGLALILRRKK